MITTLSQFLELAAQSSGQSYQAFKQLLTQLERVESRKATLQLLHQIYEYGIEQGGTTESTLSYQALKQRILARHDEASTLNLLQFPSTFLPEAWSFTFYEGLIRYAPNEYHQKLLVELGCGIGWIALALAKRYPAKQIYGVDINPKAVTCARLNLFLNAFDEEGEPVPLSDGRSLLDVVEFHESNLLHYFDNKDIEFDKIIGCIPQVLNPEPEVMETLIAETASDEYLYSLSNYFAKQGYIEDQFGLGLIASAVEQSIPMLKADGKLILNLGGRPGRSVLERLMRRRGFKVRRVWQTQVEQAADTDIDALVDIEKQTGHRFEFHMSENSEVSIDARTADRYAKAGGKIYHSVDVYEARLLFPDKVKSIFKAIQSMDQSSIRSALDLTFENEVDAEERYSFLAFLAQYLRKIQHYPYQATEGLLYFRQQLAEFFRYYLRVSVSDKDVFLTPGRRELISSIRHNYQPKLTLVDRSLRSLVIHHGSDDEEVIEAPEPIEYLVELINRLKPQLVVTRFDEFEAQSRPLVEELIECATQNQVLLVIDITDSIDLSSEPRLSGLYRYLSTNTLPPNIIIMGALMNNRVYRNYALTFSLCRNAQLLKHLSDAAELTYSRAPLMKQLYYGHLLEELLYFQRTRTYQPLVNEAINFELTALNLTNNATTAFEHPAVTGNHLPFNDETIRLDFGENELPAPEVLKQMLFESYLVRKCLGDEDKPQLAILELLRRRFNLPMHYSAGVVLGNGVAPLYAALLDLCAQEEHKIIIPSGSYGYFVAAATFKDVSVITLPTRAENKFKIDPEALEQTLRQNPASWLYINGPIVNPTGCIYDTDELNQLLELAEQYGVTVVLDTIFSGLEFSSNLPYDFSESVEKMVKFSRAKLVLLGGLSKEFAAGGLRFGYCWSHHSGLIKTLEEQLVHKPHFTLRYAVRKLLDAQLAEQPKLLQHLFEQKQTLAERANRLGEVLTQQGWNVIKPEGGLFLVASPGDLKRMSDIQATERGDDICARLFREQNVAINNSTWTGLPGYCRFVLSCSEKDFEVALGRIEQFGIA